MTRRSLFGWLVSVGTALVAAIVGLPVLLFGLSPALQPRRREIWRPVGWLRDFPVGAIQESLVAGDRKSWPRSFRAQVVFVRREAERDVVVFSRRCTDLGCPLTYDPGSTCFFCPCHGGIFTQDGARLAGPPNGPMYRYAHRVREGVLEIDLASLPPSA